tara:strand:+ start:13366 stop:14115 length:750 start_codon:yes stop_codon:yes gene_type:complete
MSTTSFTDIETEVQDQKKEPTTTSISPPEEPQTGGAISTAYGDEGPAAEDINIDHLQIFGKSSHFEPEGGELGCICINKETPLSREREALRGVVVHTRKYWKENVPYDDDTTPRFANTVEEKTAIESTTEFEGTVPVCDVTLLIERPDSFTDDEAAASIFIYEFGGKEFALGKYTVQKSQAVRENYGTINVVSRARRTKNEDATDYYFELESREKGSGSRFKWHQFVLKGTATKAPDEAVSFARSLRGE